MLDAPLTMLPAITLVRGVEMLRDGGSLCASFQGEDACVYWLVLPVEIVTHPSGDVERVGYSVPVVVDRLLGTEVQISWQHAAIIAAQIRRLLQDAAALKSLDTMSEVIGNEGKLPAELKVRWPGGADRA